MYEHMYRTACASEVIRQFNGLKLVNNIRGLLVLSEDKKLAFPYKEEYSDETCRIVAVCLSFIKDKEPSDEYLNKVYKLSNMLENNMEFVRPIFLSAGFLEIIADEECRETMFKLFGIKQFVRDEQLVKEPTVAQKTVNKEGSVIAKSKHFREK